MARNDKKKLQPGPASCQAAPEGPFCRGHSSGAMPSQTRFSFVTELPREKKMQKNVRVVLRTMGRNDPGPPLIQTEIASTVTVNLQTFRKACAWHPE